MASAFLSSVLSNTSQVLGFVKRWAVPPSSSSDPRSSVFEDLMLLERTLKRIQAVLHDAEEREIREEAVKLWLKELKEEAYKAEDVLDEYHYEELRAQAEGRASRQRKRVEGDDEEEVSGSPTPTVVSIPDGMGDRIRKIRERFDEISNDRERLRLREEDGERRVLKPIYPAPTSHMVDESSIYGRERDKKELIELVLSEAIGNGISVIPIVGKGGLGKTTIAQLVYRDSKVKEYFDLTVWVCASNGDFNVKRLTKEIIDSIPHSSDNKNEEQSLDSIQNDLMKKLEGKKVLLVLDDVWNEQQSLWESLRKPFVGAETAIRIIVTCRNGKVAEIMQTVSPHHPGILSEDESRLLFEHYAFGGQGSQRQPCFEKIGKQIVKKCSGLPLALKFIGSFLRHEEDEDKWKEFLQSELWEVDENNEILPALMLSYNRMPVHLKPCFVYCSIFPEDFEYRKTILVQMWMAQGYILPRGTRRMEDIGDEYFIDLQRRSFFDPVGYVGLYKMHDVIHDLAKFVARNEYRASVDEKLSKVHHLYVKDDEELVKSPDSYFTRQKKKKKSLDSYNPEALRTLLNYGEYGDPMVIQNIIRFPLLRCLEFYLTRIDEIPDSLGNLKHLRYLNIKYAHTEKLPESVCHLYHLQTLKLDCCHLLELPHGLGNLTNLRYLHISTEHIEKLPESVCLLHHLQTLKLDCCDLLELPHGLGNLTNLRHLDLQTLPIKRLPESLCQLHNLQKLCIKECSDLEELPSDIGSLTNLRNLEIWDTEIHYLPAGISKLTNLQISFKDFERILYVNSEGQCGIGVLKNFVNLPGHLYISGLGNLVNVDDVRDAGLEDKHELEELSLDWDDVVEDFLDFTKFCLQVASRNDADHSKNVPHLEASPEENKDFPIDEEIHEAIREHLQPRANLKRLNIYRYGGSRFPKWLGNPSSFPSLQQIHVHECENIRFLPLYIHDSLEIVDITSCPQLTSIAGMQNLTSLGALTIMDCPKLQIMAEDQLSPMPHHVRIVDCPGLVNWCQIQKINCIQVASANKLTISNTWENTMLGFDDLTSIEHLCFSTSWIFFLETDSISVLEELMVWSCTQIPPPEYLSKLTSLRRVVIKDCPGIQFLPYGLLPSMLKSFVVDSCEDLRKLVFWVQHRDALEELQLVNCPKLESVFGLNCLFFPKKLRNEQCPQLQVFTEETENEGTIDGTREKQVLNCVMIEHANSVVSPISDAKDDCEMGRFLQLGLPSGCSSQSPEQITAELSGLSRVHSHGKFYQNKSGQFVTEEVRQRHEKMLQLKEQMIREIGSSSNAGSQPICSMTDDMIVDAVLGWQLGSRHIMPSKKFHRSSSSNQFGLSDDAQVLETVRTSMSSMQGQIDYWMNRSQTLERIVATMAGRLGIDTSAHSSRHTLGQGSMYREANEADDIDNL